MLLTTLGVILIIASIIIYFVNKYNEDGGYFFIVTLENGNKFSWQIGIEEYLIKNEGDRVHFDYLRKDRFK